MRSSGERRLGILRRIERAENHVKFEEYSTHSIGGFEEVVTPSWTSDECYEIRQLVRRGHLEVSSTKGDEPWLGGGEPDAVHKETYLHLTPSGHDFLEEVYRGWWAKQVRAFWQNILTILVAVAAAWALYFIGPTK